MPLISDAAVSPGDWARRLAEQASEVAAVRTARRGEHASVTQGQTRFSGEGGVLVDGGGDLIVDDDGNIFIRGGNLHLLSVDDNSLVFIGTVIQGDDSSRGWIFRFDPGDGAATVAFALGGTPGRQFWSLRDNAGNIIVSNDATTGHGLASPWIPHDLVPTEDAEQSGVSMWPSTTVTAPGTALLARLIPIQHPVLHIGATVTTTGGGTGHWRLVITSSTTSTTVISDETGFAIHDVEIPGWGSDITFGDEVLVELEAWVTGGGTRAFVQYDRLYSKGT